ncbi:MAG: VOC family protein [Polaromonas sp.]|nr:VOC family protein [Polaromonas sp.]
MDTLLTAQLDHLVVAATSLAEGVHWCERVLGVTPGPGGEHALMGTHNRLITLATPAFPRAYLEIIAIHSGAYCARSMGARRWFDLDDRDLQLKLQQRGPQLVHWVARTAQAQAGVRALAGLGLDRGELLQASRMSAQGLLEWKITVREDGQRLFFGALPTLIQWGEVHPADSMAPSGITLQSLHASHPRPDALRACYDTLGLPGVAVTPGPPNLVVTLQTPRSLVTLESRGI